MHVYLCEACWHDRHDWCRRRCLFCGGACLCLICHSRSKETAMTTPEPIDNPASTEDAEYGEPVVEPTSEDDADATGEDDLAEQTDDAPDPEVDGPQDDVPQGADDVELDEDDEDDDEPAGDPE